MENATGPAVGRPFGVGLFGPTTASPRSPGLPCVPIADLIDRESRPFVAWAWVHA